MEKASRSLLTQALFSSNRPFPTTTLSFLSSRAQPDFLLHGSSTNPDVVLFKENHTQPTEAATLDRKSGEAEGPAVRHSCAPLLPAYNQIVHQVLMEIPTPALSSWRRTRTRAANIGPGKIQYASKYEVVGIVKDLRSMTYDRRVGAARAAGVEPMSLLLSAENSATSATMRCRGVPLREK
jgi:hypothetical protein